MFLFNVLPGISWNLAVKLCVYGAMMHVLLVQFITYGFFQCVDGFLFIFTFLPLRFLKAIIKFCVRGFLTSWSVTETFSYTHYRATQLCWRGLGSRNSVRLSVRLSVGHTRALWLIQRTYQRYFYTTWKGNPSSFLPHNSGWWAKSPFTFNGRSKWPTSFKNRSRRQISACNVSTVRASERSSIMTNRKSYTGFPTSYRWSAYVTSKSPKGLPKKQTIRFLE